jgi:exodeoxyribonuclease VII large subunit
VDFTIADFVADHRAPTPTAAAEMVVARREDLVEQVRDLGGRFLRCIQSKIDSERDALGGLARRLSDPRRRLRENQMLLDELSLSLWRRFQDRLVRLRQQLAHGSERLGGLSPLAVLERGYSIAHKIPEGSIVKDSATLAVGDRLKISFARGKALCTVEEKE